MASAGELGSEARPLRAAVVGSGPAGLYTADFLLKGGSPNKGEPPLVTEVDVFERLAAPYGLVRSGVAPDHQGIKKVTKAFDRTLSNERLRLFGNVAVGRDVTHDELLQHYDQIVYATGSASDRRLGIPGEDAEGSHAATAFVGWYNGHPDFKDEHFDFATKRAIVVGLGNVAMDVARLLAKNPDELADTDIADTALNALRQSQIREVVLLGRRGPAQAAFTPREIQDIAELDGVQVLVDGGPVDPPGPELSGPAKQNVQFVSEASRKTPEPGKRSVRLMFLASPAEILTENGKLKAVKVEHNRLVDSGDGRLRAEGTGEYQTIEAGLIFRSIGYRGVALPGLPFDERSGTIPNTAGRVLETKDGKVLPRVYTCGWIKRGPSGLIGTNKSDAKDTAGSMLADARSAGRVSELPERSAIVKLLEGRGVRIVSTEDWQQLDALELQGGSECGKVRKKFVTNQEMLDALLR